MNDFLLTAKEARTRAKESKVEARSELPFKQELYGVAIAILLATEAGAKECHYPYHWGNGEQIEKVLKTLDELGYNAKVETIMDSLRLKIQWGE